MHSSLNPKFNRAKRLLLTLKPPKGCLFSLRHLRPLRKTGHARFRKDIIMTHFSRAALFAAATVALCACVTTQKIIPKTDIMGEAPSPISTSETAETPMAEITTSQPSTETLLYGAMTKFELMKFVETVRAANLEGALEGPGQLTVFAPNDQAFEFARLGADADIPAILKGHIVKGAMDAAALKAAVTENGAPVKLMSLSGQELTIYVMSGQVKVAGPNGTLATVTQADMMQSNGVMHHISGVLKPKF